MPGGLLGLIIGVILLVAVVAIFFLTIDKIVKDALLQKIGKIVIGVMALVLLLSAAWGALFGGGGGLPAITGAALISFAIGLLVIIAVVFILDRVIAFFGFMVAELQYLLGILALIAILVVAGKSFFGGGGGFNIGGWTPGTPSIMRGK